MSARPRSTTAKGESTRERIVEAAAEAFDQRGYLGVNLGQVVDSLGLTKGALYYFFPTKEDLAVEIVTRHFGIGQPLTRRVLAEYDNVVDALIALMREVASLYQTNPITRAGSRLSTERHLVGRDLPEPYVGWIKLVTKLLGDGLARGQVRAGISPEATAQLMVSFFYGAQEVSDFLTARRDLMDRVEAFWEVLEPWLRAPALPS